MKFKDAFESNSVEGGRWALAFPADALRRYPLFNSYDLWGSSIANLTNILTMTIAETALNEFTAALLDFELEGLWLGKMMGRPRYGSVQLRLQFASEHDLDMMKMFGIRGTAWVPA